MKVSLDWLSQYIDLKLDTETLAKSLTMAGLEVEAIETCGAIPYGIVAARILERKPHPDADKLSVCSVEYGSGSPLQIVCGAQNCDAGMSVPLATIGTVFSDPSGKPFEIKKCKLRGVESFGMLCSAKELGLSSDGAGLMPLDASLAPGTPLSEVFKSDTVYTVEITPNRPDWLSHWGVARDIAALCGGSLKLPQATLPSPSDSQCPLVEVLEPSLCPLYTARLIKGVKIAQSPEWLKARLSSVGIRPINNVVDITNFVMMELGQPLHAFDLKLLSGSRIVVRPAKDGEIMKALDGKDYKLDPSTLVIADSEKPVALAGIMGGEHSGVLESTSDILLESAFFDPSSVRASSRRLAISSDSSYRFERRVDPKMVAKASDRAASLILELAGGSLASELLSVSSHIPEPQPVHCDFSRMLSLLGMTALDQSKSVSIFKSLGMQVKDLSDASCSVIPPSYRADIACEADLAEELARIHGLDKLPDIPVVSKRSAHFSQDAYSAIESLRNALVSCGLHECVNTSMIDEASALSDPAFSKDDIIALSNPISLDLAILRPSLLPGMLATVKRNISRHNLDLALFEIGRTFCKTPSKFPEERDECIVAITGRPHPERYSKEASVLFDFYDLKGIIESLLSYRRLESFSFAPCSDPRFENGACAELLIDGSRAAVLGRLSPHLTKGMRLQTPLYVAVIQMESLLGAKTVSQYYRPISQFPAVSRDVAFIAPDSLRNSQVVDFIMSAKVKNLLSVNVFDIFSDASIGDGRKSMAYSLTFRSNERTLTDEEVNQAHESLRERLKSGLGVELR